MRPVDGKGSGCRQEGCAAARNRVSCRPAVGAGVKILFENQLGPADFHLPNKTCVLYLSERDVIAGNGYKRKLVRFRNVSFQHSLFLSGCSMRH